MKEVQWFELELKYLEKEFNLYDYKQKYKITAKILGIVGKRINN